MNNKQNEYQEPYDLLSEKIRRLRRTHAIETDPTTKLKYEKEIEEAEKERDKLVLFFSETDKHFTDFWNVFLGNVYSDKIFVVLSAKWAFDWVNGVPTESPGHTVQVCHREVEGFLNLQKKLYPTRFSFEIAHSAIDKRTETVRGKYKREERLIVIGSPHANKLCGQIMAEVKPPYRFDADEEGHKCIRIYQDKNGKLTDKPKSSVCYEVG